MNNRLIAKKILALGHSGQRPLQEDCSAVNEKRGIFAVADGFGGPNAGVAAAQMACQSIREFLENGAEDRDATLPFEIRKYYTLSGNILFNAFLYANRKLQDLNKSKVIDERGGASLVAGYVSGDHFSIGAVGVCNAALFRNGKFQTLLNPRTYQRYMDPTGQNTGQEVYSIPLNPLGLTDDLEPEIYEFKLLEGDRVCFFTDGVDVVHLENWIGSEINKTNEINEINLRECSDNSSILLAYF